ncbi:MAG: transposase [Verrucomicrobiales bacterium]|nr:transposase [Verrucomicrobiales bacterium]
MIYRSKRSWHTKQNFKIFTAADFIAAIVEHIPPKGQQTVRYYGRYSNKSRGLDAKHGRARPELESPNQPEKKQMSQPTLFILPAPEAKSRSALRPLWRDLIMKIWSARRSLGEGWGRRSAYLSLL